MLSRHPEVLEVAVIGVPHPEWGEAIKAVVVPRSPGALDLRALRSFARGHLAEFKLPTTLDFVQRLPRTPAGKVQKATLRDPYWRDEARQVN